MISNGGKIQLPYEFSVMKKPKMLAEILNLIKYMFVTLFN